MLKILILLWGIDTNSHGRNSNHQNNYVSHVFIATQKTHRISTFDVANLHDIAFCFMLFIHFFLRPAQNIVNRQIRNLLMKIWKNNPWNTEMAIIRLFFCLWLRKHEGQFTKFYPKFHLTREFLTFANIIIIWFSLLVWISHIVAAHTPISHFSGARAPISHFWSLNFSLCRRARANFSLLGFNFSLFARRHSEFLTFCTQAGPTVICRRAPAHP